MPTKPSIDYIEMPSSDFKLTRSFFENVFEWRFQTFGEDYLAFFQNTPGVTGGFYHCDRITSPSVGAPLIVFYSKTLEATCDHIRKAGAEITQSIFPFPGGRRFHFCAPASVEMGVWSDL